MANLYDQLCGAISDHDDERAREIMRECPSLIWSSITDFEGPVAIAALAIRERGLELLKFIYELIMHQENVDHEYLLVQAFHLHDDHGISAFDEAFRKLDCLKFLVTHCPSGLKTIDYGDGLYGTEGLDIAVENDDVECFDFIVRHCTCASPFKILERQDEEDDYRTFAHTAAYYGSLKILNYLAEHSPKKGLALEAEDEMGETPFNVAVFSSKSGIPCMEFLIEKSSSGVNILEDRSTSNPVWEAVYSRKLKELQWIIERAPSGAKLLEIQDELGRTPAHRAGREGDSDTLEFIVRNAPSGIALLRQKDKQGETPLTSRLPEQFYNKATSTKIRDYFTPERIKEIGLERESKIVHSQKTDKFDLSSLVIRIIGEKIEVDLRESSRAANVGAPAKAEPSPFYRTIYPKVEKNIHG